MSLYWVQFAGVEWGSYVTAESRNRAKVMFWGMFAHDGEYIDIRCRKVKAADGFPSRVLDMNDDPLLAKLGVEYGNEV